MGKNISVVPMLLKHRIDKTGKSQIVIRVYLNGNVVLTEKLGHKIEPKFWDPDKRQVQSSATNAGLLNSLIKKKIAEFEERFLKSELLNQKITPNTIIRTLKNDNPTKSYYDFCNEVIPVKYQKESTKKQQYGEISKLKKFRPELYFGDIDYKFLTQYKHYMATKLENSANTIWKTFKAMYAMLNEAERMGGYFTEHPFQGFDRGKYQQGKRKFLEISDCDKIHELLKGDIPDRLRLVGVYYLFMCYTGFRFNDAVKFFNYNEHVVDNERIVFQTQKSQTEVSIYIHDRLREVLLFIKNHSLQITNQEFNRYTKVLATMAGIDIAITAHTGRHTFGATLAELNVPIESAQKLLGHRDINSTRIYYHIKNKTLDKEMMKWNEL